MRIELIYAKMNERIISDNKSQYRLVDFMVRCRTSAVNTIV